MLLSVVSVLVVAQSSSEIPEGLMNNPIFLRHATKAHVLFHKIPIYFLISCFLFNFSYAFSVTCIRGAKFTAITYIKF